MSASIFKMYFVRCTYVNISLAKIVHLVALLLSRFPFTVSHIASLCTSRLERTELQCCPCLLYHDYNSFLLPISPPQLFACLVSSLSLPGTKNRTNKTRARTSASHTIALSSYHYHYFLRLYFKRFLSLLHKERENSGRT